MLSPFLVIHRLRFLELALESQAMSTWMKKAFFHLICFPDFSSFYLRNCPQLTTRTHSGIAVNFASNDPIARNVALVTCWASR
jgi:hypothetical protein